MLRSLRLDSSNPAFTIIKGTSYKEYGLISAEELTQLSPRPFFLQCNDLDFGTVSTLESHWPLTKVSRVIVQKTFSIKNKLSNSVNPNRNPTLSLEEYRQLIIETYKTEMSGRLSYLSEKEHSKNLTDLTIDMDGNNCFVLNKDDSTISLLVLRKFQFGEMRVNLVAWAWIHPSLSLDERKMCQNLNQIWIAGLSNLPTLASINVENQRSLKLAARMGFVPTHVGVTTQIT